MVATQFFASLFFASVALARVSPAHRRAASKPGPKSHRSSPVSNVAIVDHTAYNGNWAGAVYSEPKGTFTSVVGTFIIPEPSGADGSSSAWVGIDGASCQSALIQTGVDFTIKGGVVSYDAWIEYVPAASQSFNGSISFASGDSVTLTLAVTSSTAGTATIENKTNGQKVSQSISSTTPLCQQDAEWIVEDYGVNGSEVAFDNFGTIVFTNSSATKADGTTVTPSTAALYDIRQNNVNMTSSSLSDGGITVKWLSAA